MSEGSPDYSGKIQAAYRVIDNIEPRLISSLSRSGRVYWQDDFEKYKASITEKWDEDAATVELGDDFPLLGMFHMKITTNATAGYVAQAAKEIALAARGRYGYELWFETHSVVANVRYIEFQIYYFDGLHSRYVYARWCGTVNGVLMKKWQYVNSKGDYTDIPDGGQTIRMDADWLGYHHFKLITDFKAEKYVKLICDDKEFDISTLDMPVVDDPTEPCCEILVRITCETATAIIVRVDDVIFTDQEP